MYQMLLTLLVIAVIISAAVGFSPTKFITRNIPTISMAYIPDGLTKAQWEAIQKKEEEEKKKKANGTLGTARFKSRSFEAWQKAGGVHLFPVDPNKASYEERPYMQRRGGDWEGNDLKSQGLVSIL
jgi:hypothetical protein